MIPFLVKLKVLLKGQSYTIDNHVFKLHYKVTVGALALFTLIVITKQFFGSPISCTRMEYSIVSQQALNDYCWIQNTYIVKEDSHKLPDVSDNTVQHKYYQWVCFVLVLQAMFFYLPRYLWNVLEADRVKSLVLGPNVTNIEPEEIQKRQELILRYLKSHRGQHIAYTFCYVFCECLNLLNVVGQMFLLDIFLRGKFTKFGIHIYEDPGESVNPVTEIFPRMTICKYIYNGASGLPVRQNVYCTLSISNISQKIFVFLWFWFVFLMIVTSVALVYRIVVFLWPAFRRTILKMITPLAAASDVEKVTVCLSVSDWFILYQLAKNIKGVHMAELLHRHAKELGDTNKYTTLCSSPDVRNVFAGNEEESVGFMVMDTMLQF